MKTTLTPCTSVTAGDEVWATTGIYIGKVTQVYSTLFYVLDSQGGKSGYGTKGDCFVRVACQDNASRKEEREI